MEYLECQDYLNIKNELYDLLLSFIDDESNINISFQSVINFIDSQKYQENTDEFKSILYMIREINRNHHRTPSSLEKYDKFFSYYSEFIKKNITNIELYNIFAINPQILLILFDKKIIVFDNNIAELILMRKYSKPFFYQFEGDPEPDVKSLLEQKRKKKTIMCNYKYYFFPEIKPHLDEWSQSNIEKELLKIDKNIFDNFEKNRKIGENDSYLCQLIRQDSIEEFDTYVNKTNLKLESLIKPSIFETNQLLIRKQPSLIEYASFFGSIKIFNYLRLNEVDLNPSLWIYAIHSNNPEIIHILEQSKIEPDDSSYMECLKESIKCHHNEIARYIRDNLMDQEIKNDFFYFRNNQFSFGFHYYNYEFLENMQYMPLSFLYACKYGHFQLVKLLIKMDDFDENQSIILIIFILNEAKIYISL